RREWSRSVPNAEFVEDVGIRKGEVGHYIIGKQQSSEHWSMNDSPGPFSVAANRVQAGLNDCRLNRGFVNLIKIHFNSACQVGFLSKRHINKADRAHTHCSSPVIYFYLTPTTGNPPGTAWRIPLFLRKNFQQYVSILSF